MEKRWACTALWLYGPIFTNVICEMELGGEPGEADNGSAADSRGRVGMVAE
jgi:hypothetical protein